MFKILAIDDDRAILRIVEKSLQEAGYRVDVAGSAADGLAAFRRDQPDLVLLDVVLLDGSGLDVVDQLRALDRKIPVIFLTATHSSEVAITAISKGAFDFVMKPIDVESLSHLVSRALETSQLTKQGISASVRGGDDGTVGTIIGRSPAMVEVFKSIALCAAKDLSVLLRGESGSGKEVVARSICEHSSRNGEPFIVAKCGNLSDELLERELFGHEEGVFADAPQMQVGKIEQADRGTLLLDDVAELGPRLQGKCLRLLTEGTFERVGGREPVKVDVRVIASTQRDLDEMSRNREFREDLLFRLRGYEIGLPPLRERGDDITLLIRHFVQVYGRQYGSPEFEGLSQGAVDELVAYSWPGNVRELQSVLRQAIIDTRGTILVPEFLPAFVREEAEQNAGGHGSGGGEGLQKFVASRLTSSDDLYAESIAFIERRLFEQVLRHTRGNQSRAALILGITRGKLRSRIREFELPLQAYSAS